MSYDQQSFFTGVEILDTTQSLSLTTGALTISGGLGVVGNTFLNNTSLVNSTQTNILNTNISSSSVNVSGRVISRVNAASFNSNFAAFPIANESEASIAFFNNTAGSVTSEGNVYVVGHNVFGSGNRTFGIGTQWNGSILTMYTSGTSRFNNNLEVVRSDTIPSLLISGGITGGNGATVRLLGAGQVGSSVQIDMSTYDPVANDPTSRIRTQDLGDFSSNLFFETKIPGSTSNALTSRLAIRSDGKVGINTTVPSHQLHVSGDVFISGGSTIPNLLTTNITVTNSILSNSNVTTSTIGSLLNTNLISTNSTVTNSILTTSSIGTLINTNASMGIMYVTNSAGIMLNGLDRPMITRGFDPFLTGNFAGAGRWGLFMEGGATTLGIPAGGSGRRHQFVSYNDNSTINTTYMTILETGNVGIGTTTPGKKLEVNGDTQVTGLTTSSLFCTGQIFQNGIQIVASTTGSQWQGAVNSNLWYTGGNIGIGTSSPISKLHVSGGNIQLNNSGTRSSLIISGGVSSGQGSKIQLIGGGGGGSSVEIDLTTYDPGANDPTSRISAVDENFSSNLLFQTKIPGAATNALATRLYIRNDGNVGIGTTSPGYGLQVNTDSFITTMYATNLSVTNNTLTNIRAFNMTSTLITVSNMVMTNSTISNIYSTSGLIEGGLTVRRNTSGWNPSIYLNPPASGNENYMIFNNIAGGPTSIGSWLVGTPGGATGGTFQIGFANTTYAFNIMTSGNVGIGTTSPGNQLTLSTDSAAKPSTNTWTISSDERLKTNITQANLDICYNNVKNIPLKRYTWRDDIYTPEEVPDRSKLGWIAQDVEQYIPKAVEQKEMHGYSDCRTLNSDQIIASLYGAVQKLIIEVETLKTQLNNV